MKKVIALALSAIMLMGMLAGCGTYQDGPSASPSTAPNQSSSTPEAKTTDFSIAYNGIVTLNPVMSQSSNDHNIFYLTQAQLVRYYGSEVQLDAAERYDVSDDATVYTFYLRDGLTWSDGQPLTAADFEYSVKCLLDPQMGSPAAASWYAIKNSEAYSSGEISDWAEVGIKALDEKTVEFTLERPLGSFDRTIACKHIYPLREDFVESVGVDKLGSSVDTMLYSGAYVINDWVLESSMELEKNDLYWDAAASFPTDFIHLVEVKDANTEVAMFENGEVDALEVISSQYYEYLNDYRYDTPGGGFMFMWMNQNGTSDEAAKVMQNVNFRQALSYGFDRSATCNAVNSATTPANTIVDPSFAGPNGGKFVDEYSVDAVPLTGDTAKAKEYLAAALGELGYTDISQLPDLKLVTWDSAEQKLLSETIIDQWKQNLGLTNIQLNQYVIGTAIGTFFDLTYDIFFITWETDVLPTDIMESMMTGGECNAGIWSNSEYDELVLQAVNELDPIKQAELTAEAQQIFMDDAGIVPIYLSGEVHAVKDYVSGFQIGASDGFEFNNLVVSK